MGNIIVSDNIIEIVNADITARSENSDYPKINTQDFWHLKRQFRATDQTVNDWLLKVDFGAEYIVVAILLNDINFDKVTIQGHATDSWTSPSFTTTVTVSQDERVQRYKVYIPLTSFSYRYLRIFIPSDASITDGSIWRVGSLVCLSTITELTTNMNYGYQRGSQKSIQNITFPDGSLEQIKYNDNLRWNGNLNFNSRNQYAESELWAINDMSSPLVYYENIDDTSKAYLCSKNTFYSGSHSSYNIINGSIIELTELI